MRVLLTLLVITACSPTVGTPARRDSGMPPVADQCAESCVQDSDCLADYHCRNNRCGRDVVERSCETQLQCQAQISGWMAGCMDDNACPAGFSCVGDEEEGYCAQTSTTAAPCTGGTPNALMMARRNGNGSVLVCGEEHAKCYQRKCFSGCVRDSECSGEMPACNTSTGKCECRTGSCVTNASVCEDGQCRCAKDADCTVASDVCFNGVCACSSASVCPSATAHPGTVWVCE